MFETIGEHAQGKGLNAVNRFLTALAITQHTGKLYYFGKPTAIIFLFDFNGQRQDPLSYLLKCQFDPPFYLRIDASVKDTPGSYLLSSECRCAIR